MGKSLIVACTWKTWEKTATTTQEKERERECGKIYTISEWEQTQQREESISYSARMYTL